VSEIAYSALERFRLVERLFIAGAAGFLAVLSGWLVGRGHVSPTIVACLVALAVLAAITAWNPGVSIGVLLLVVMNGLPLLDVEPYLVAGFRVSDLAVMLLAGALAVRIHARGASRAPWAGRLTVWGVVFGLWWFVVLVRTSLLEGVPLLDAFLFGRDFIYFAILLPLLVMAFRGRREFIGCIGTLFAGALVFSVGQLAISAAGASSSGWASWFAHATSVSESEGVTRVYASMGEALPATVAFGLGLALMPPKKRFARTTGFILFVVAAVAMLYLFTRALYIGTAISLLVTVIIWLFGVGARNAARRGVAVLATLILVLIVAVDYSTLTGSVRGVDAASARTGLTLTELEQGAGNLSYRYDLTRKMLDILDSNWVEGLGFLHPDSRPIAGLPAESIRNTDLGVMNSLMTMGAVGTILLYAAPIAILLALVRRWYGLTGSHRDRDIEWFFFGATMWLVLVLVTSLSLVTLFSVSGLVMSAALLGCAARCLDEPPAKVG
jgi:hypothetical protein